MGKKEAGENVQVVVRVRPISAREAEQGTRDIVSASLPDNSVTVRVDDQEKAFTFDRIYTKQFTQKHIYLQTIHPLVESVLNGFNATVFAYGQSGTGKTYTMTGGTTPETQGVIPNALSHIFESVRAEEKASDNKKAFTLRVSYVELYNGKCRDLFTDSKTHLEIKENENKVFYVKGLEQVKVVTPEQCIKLIDEGMNRREVGATQLNQDSSRSHSVFAVEITSVSYEEEPPIIVTSKLNMVDLAGSERQSKTAAEGERAKEGANINLSLTALGSVIDVLVKGKGHIPFRSSPLTMLLKDSLGGNCRTVMFATCSPSEYNTQETVSTLRFADRAKRIKNKPRVQLDPKDELLVQLREEIQSLKQRLKDSGINPEAETVQNDELERLRIEITGLKTEIASLNGDFAKAEAGRKAGVKEAAGLRDDLATMQDTASSASRQLLQLSQAVYDFTIAALPSQPREAWLAELSAEAGGASLAIGASDALPVRSAVSGLNKVLALQKGGSGGGPPAKIRDPTGATATPDSTGLTPSPQSSVGSGNGTTAAAAAAAVLSAPAQSPHPPRKDKSKKRRDKDPVAPALFEGGVQGGGAEGDPAKLLAAQHVTLDRLKKQLLTKTELMDALKKELGETQALIRRSEHGFQLQLETNQSRLIQEHNNRLEEVIESHKSELQKMKKASAESKKKLRKQKEVSEELEGRFDQKVVEFDSLYRDFEELKLQSMKQLKANPPGGTDQKGYPVNHNTVKLTSLASAAVKIGKSIAGREDPLERMCSRSAPLAPSVREDPLNSHRPLSSFHPNEASSPHGAAPPRSEGFANPISPPAPFVKAPLPGIAQGEAQPRDTLPMPAPPRGLGAGMSTGRKYE